MYMDADFKVVLEDFIDGVEDVFGEKLKDIVLFGSYARGDFDLESDVDIAILVDIKREEENHFINDIVALISKIDKLHNFSILLSPIVISNSFFEEWQETIPFYKNIKNEGVKLIA